MQSTTGPLTGKKVSLGERPCACKGTCQLPRTAASGSVPQTSHHTNREETLRHLPGNKVPPSIRSPHRHFPTEALLQREETPVFWVLHWPAGSAQLQTYKIGTISFGNSVDHPKQYQIEIGNHFGVSKEHNFIKQARPNKHKKEITRHCHNRKHTKVLPKLELAGKRAIVRDPFQTRILLITLSKHGIMAKKTPNWGKLVCLFCGKQIRNNLNLIYVYPKIWHYSTKVDRNSYISS